jgi:hypothetical protein
MPAQDECTHDKGFVRVISGIGNERTRGHFEGEDWIIDQFVDCEIHSPYETGFQCTECDKELSKQEAMDAG